MVILKTEEEIKKMEESGKLLANVHKGIAKIIKPGISTYEIDQFVEEYLKEHNAIPEQKGYQGFPYAICASINDEICHGFPREESLKDGDIVTIDMVVNIDGWLADSAWSYGVGNISDKAQKLLDVTKKALYLGIEGYPSNITLDPRHFPYLKGTAKYVEDLSGKWCPNQSYAANIIRYMNEIKSI